MSRNVTRFAGLLLVVGAVSCIYLIATDARPAAIGVVVLVVGVALAGHVWVMGQVEDETIRAIELVDPTDPEDLGRLAGAVRERVAKERLAAERLGEDLRSSIESAAMAVLIIGPDGSLVASAGVTTDLITSGTIPRLTNSEVLALADEVGQLGNPAAETVVMGVRGRSYQWVISPLEGGHVGAVVTDVTEADRVQAMRRTFVTDASHELRTPVASIQAGAGALQMAIGKDDEKARKLAARLEEQSGRLGRIVSDLLDLARLESRPTELGPVDLSAVVRAEVAAARPEAVEAAVGLSEEVEEIRISGVQADVGLAVGNLLRNAITYTPDGGQVAIRCLERGGRAIVEVEDTGIGIPASDRELVFHRFHRVDSARSRDTGGTGLGLAIVRHVAGAHGGSVSVSSVVGQGSTFALDLGLVSTN